MYDNCRSGGDRTSLRWHCQGRRLRFLDDRRWAGNEGIKEGQESMADRWQARKVSTMHEKGAWWFTFVLRWEEGEMVNDDGKRTLFSNPTSSIPAGSHEGAMN